MKIILKPTEEDYNTCSISCKGDDLTVEDMFQKLIIPMLLAFGYHQESIEEYLKC